MMYLKKASERFFVKSGRKFPQICMAVKWDLSRNISVGCLITIILLEQGFPTFLWPCTSSTFWQVSMCP